MANLLQHSKQFRARRFLNWFPLGLGYAFLYMGRYSFIPAKEDMTALLTNEGQGIVGMAGAITYGVAFWLNGPLSERYGGRWAMLMATAGSAIVNFVIGLMLWQKWTWHFLPVYAALISINMYFQSYAAIAIVKVNAAWFHVKERGVFGGIFGIMISSGLFLAYSLQPAIMKYLFPGRPHLYFVIPGFVLAAAFVATIALIRDTPEHAGLGAFDTGSAKDFDEAGGTSTLAVFKRLLTHRVVMTIAFMELCTGVLRDGMNYWFGNWAKQSAAPGVREWLGVGLFLAGMLGGLVAGFLSDKVFQSRRPPVAGLLYGVMAVLAAVIYGSMTFFGLRSPTLPYVLFAAVVAGAFCVIGTHGVLSGASTADFGGKRATAIVVGVIDGFVYLGVAIQSVCLGFLTARSWTYWGLFLLPFALVGLFLSTRIWRALPARGGGGGH
jgi:OPA family glycerol-3-phosphate transporter-like MFS transporter